MGMISDNQLPHHTRITGLVIQRFKAKYNRTAKEMKNEIRDYLGCVAYIWSSMTRTGYMAVTAYYISRDPAPGDLVLRSRRHVRGKHGGENVGQTIIKKAGCEGNISVVTMDNMTTNDKAMEETVKELEQLDIPFDIERNQVRYCPHINNISSKADAKESPVGKLILSEKYRAQLQRYVLSRIGFEALNDFCEFLACTMTSSKRTAQNTLRSNTASENHTFPAIPAGYAPAAWPMVDKPRSTLQE
ncbi:uncharacterized protein SCHCODRAFT_01031784 [Schizophyllum commune H4-8]|uniref:Uncharacterized protein n=1 Tax=Schizophyllum commune (strain H4-8 / FGSC 9210) TaxID=578458 RepID=D8PYZ5_SCHCM|nr:uncharacterized protein SCHCODRAFT_01031784 [Schizophyllum commune H4-8]KAI5896167.1 hypothetical protein SCHCODRAFT_01031784 [Schizophyllum commune H4-8]